MLPNPHFKGEVEKMVRVANCVLADKVYSPANELFRYSLDEVFNIVVNTVFQAAAEGRMSLLTSLDPTGPLVKLRLANVLGFSDDLCISTRNLQHYLQDEFSYSLEDAVFRVEDFERHRPVIEELWGCPVAITRMPDNPFGVTIRPASVKLPALIQLDPPGRNSVLLGTDIFSGEVVADNIRDLPHMLVVGTSGFGKSVFLNQLITQLLMADLGEVAELVLVDLKGGVEFHAYARTSNRVQVVWKFEDVVKAVQGLVELLVARQGEMVANNWRLYPGRRVFFIVDEFAQIQLYPYEGREGKATHERLISNLNRLSMLGRAVGIVIVAAIQKATTDVMDSSFRMNLQGQVSFRVPNRLMAASMFGGVEHLRVDPMTLRKGQFIYYDPTIGATRYLQAHIAAE